MSIELTLSPVIEAFVVDQASTKTNGDVSTYLTHLILEERDRAIRRALFPDDLHEASPEEQAGYRLHLQQQIDQTLLHSIAQGDAQPMSRGDWDDLRREAHSRAAKRMNGSRHE